jgi:hypothetical protein
MPVLWLSAVCYLPSFWVSGVKLFLCREYFLTNKKVLLMHMKCTTSHEKVLAFSGVGGWCAVYSIA